MVSRNSRVVAIRLAGAAAYCDATSDASVNQFWYMFSSVLGSSLGRFFDGRLGRHHGIRNVTVAVAPAGTVTACVSVGSRAGPGQAGGAGHRCDDQLAVVVGARRDRGRGHREPGDAGGDERGVD